MMRDGQIIYEGAWDKEHGDLESSTWRSLSDEKLWRSL